MRGAPETQKCVRAKCLSRCEPLGTWEEQRLRRLGHSDVMVCTTWRGWTVDSSRMSHLCCVGAGATDEVRTTQRCR
jgi:hypothetical protein